MQPISGPHIAAPLTVAATMRAVMVALLPATLFGLWQFGWPALFLWLITLTSALLSETVALHVAAKPLRPLLADGSALLTAWLLALSLPPWSPWWIGALGGVLAVVVGKQLFGGIGQNLFNPAMVARVALLISFPVEMTRWVTPLPLTTDGAPDLRAALAITFGQGTPDALSGATLLGHAKSELSRGNGLDGSLAGIYDPLDRLLGLAGGSMGETSALLLLLGGVYLLARGIISWQIPVAMLAGLALPALLLHGVDPVRYADPLFHLLTGGAVLGAFFIATDPVTSPASRAGRLLFGAGCGLLTYVIRTFGGFPEGVAFAVLLMNAATPLIDHWLRPRIFGRSARGEPLRYDADPGRRE